MLFRSVSQSRYSKEARKLGFSEEEFPVFTCTGGGRCFPVTEEGIEIVDVDLYEKILEIEKK